MCIFWETHFFISEDFADRAETERTWDLLLKVHFDPRWASWFYIMFTRWSCVFLRPPRRLPHVSPDNCLPCAAALLQGFEGFPSQSETLFSLGFTCSQQPGTRAVGTFFSSGNAVFSLRDKQGGGNWWKSRCYFLDVFFFCVLPAVWYWITASVGHTIKRQFACVFCLSFWKLDLSAARGSAIPHTVFARTATSRDRRAKQMLTLQAKHSEYTSQIFTYGDVRRIQLHKNSLYSLCSPLNCCIIYEFSLEAMHVAPIKKGTLFIYMIHRVTDKAIFHQRIECVNATS